MSEKALTWPSSSRDFHFKVNIYFQHYTEQYLLFYGANGIYSNVIELLYDAMFRLIASLHSGGKLL